MPKTHDETPVVFRNLGDDEVIALFPTLPGGGYGECLDYLHIGQHGSADYSHVVRTSKAATPEQYADLQAELVTVGYDDLKVYKREQPWMHRARMDAHNAQA